MSCNYTIGNLKKEIYLVGENAIDNQSLYIDHTTPQTTIPTAYKLKVLDISNSEETQMNGRRYFFNHGIKFLLDGFNRNLMDVILSYRHFAFANEDGQIFLLNPKTKTKITYEVKLEDGILTTQFEVKCDSNYPFVPATITNILTGEYDDCGYDSVGYPEVVENLRKYVKRNNTTITYVDNNIFVKTDLLDDTFSFVEDYDNGVVTDTISFSMSVDDMKHYKYIEYSDNRWSFVIKFGSYFIPVGFNLGMIPSYTIEGDDEDMSVKMTFIEKYNTGLTPLMMNTVTYSQLAGYTYEFVEYGAECVDVGLAKYVLKQKKDGLGNFYDDYKCLVGYTSYFPELNITGTFDSEVTFYSDKCVDDLYMRTNLPDTLTFNLRNQEQTYLIDTNAESWTLVSMKDDLSDGEATVTVTPSTGSGGKREVVIKNTAILNNTPKTSKLLLTWNTDNTETFNVVRVRKAVEDVFPYGATYDADYKEQIYTIPCNYAITNVSIDSGTATINNNTIQIPLEHNEIAPRTFTITATTTWGQYILTLTQAQQYVQWRVTGSACYGDDLKEVKTRFVSDTLLGTYEPTDITMAGNVIEADCPACMEFEEMDVENGSYCDGTNAWVVVETRRSYDNWATYEVVNKTLGSWISTCSLAARTFKWKLSDIEGEWEGHCCLMYQRFYTINSLPGIDYEVVPWQLSPDANGTEQIVPCS